MADPLVSTEWLADHLDAPDVRIADASWYLDDGRNPKAEFLGCHIPGSVFFDIDDISDPNTDLPHMLPDPVRFSSKVRKLGLGDGNRIVIYDGAGHFSAARVWWSFRVMGHEDVFILDGGLPKWLTEGRETDDLPIEPTPRHFTARKHGMYVRDLEQMITNLESKAEQVIDARSPGRFTGAEADPRPGVRAGHIPGSINVHYRTLLNSDETMKSPSELAALFAASGVDLSRPAITTCGSGVTAALVASALKRAGQKDVAVYDGSWAEWGARDDLPVATS